MQSFRVTYYTGKSSRGFDAMLSSRGDSLFISYLNEGEEPVHVQWKVQEVRRLSSTGSLATYQYGNFPFQSIVTDTPELIQLLEQNQKYLQRQYGRLLRGGWGMKAGLAAVFIGLVAVFYFVIVPGSAALLAGQLPQETETDLGEQLYRAVMTEYEEDERLTALATEFADQLEFSTDYPIQITVVHRNELNAFALPGGRIVVYDALLYQLESPEAFTALLGHEVAHVKYRHSLKSLARTLSSYLFVSFVLGDVNGITSVLVENADMLNRMSYSRELEQSADYEALEVLQANQLDQAGLVQLMEALEDENEFAPLRLLSSHPLTQERIAYARQHTQEQQQVMENARLQQLWEEMKGGGEEEVE